jgi:hypothetical protein
MTDPITPAKPASGMPNKTSPAPAHDGSKPADVKSHPAAEPTRKT